MRLGGVLSCCLVLSHPVASAAAVELTGESPPTCPTRAVIVRQVEGFLGRPLGSDGDGLAVQIELAGDRGAGFRLVLTIRSEDGERRRVLEHDDCAKLGEATALLIALAIDPEAVHADAEPATNPAATGSGDRSPLASTAARATQPATSRPPRRPPATTAPRGPIGELSGVGHLLFGAGVLPGAGFGAGGVLGVKRGCCWRMLGTFSFWPRRVHQSGLAEVELGLVSAGLRGCWSHGKRWEGSLCAGPELGSLAGRGRELAVNRVASDRWSALALEATLGYAMTRGLLLQGGLEFDPALERPRFEVDGQGEVHRPAAAGFRARLGLGVRFGADGRSTRDQSAGSEDRAVKGAP